ncbi:Fanconi anemia group C protein isoform X1 [Oncorhynchus keta]|uniref:Fanconi anemia group C protein isoform X1 n=2 Tax=Oncorhynchus keta TaxID=8018 RepID=UPI0015FAEDE7|nr:Fanconi anemia group C protein isoform X1 [Oncorhynchus keta]XP_035642010.1 Fanconi anemia group C protein isoform X1 [Oncorhynchus keta]XP_035642011.1 Fanconi anemia group C protein isoform X1 [Oncorhynchus keta]
MGFRSKTAQHFSPCCCPSPNRTMSQAQTGSMAGLKPQEVAFWLGKAVEWGQTESPDTQRDTCLHLGPLRAFLQLLLTDIHMRSSTTETMRTIPFIGQFLGRLCWNPYVTVDAESRSLLLQSLWSLYSEEPHNAVERKANQWIRNVLCQLATEEENSATHMLVKHMGLPPKEYNVKVLRKMVWLLVEEVGESCSSLADPNQRCSCDSVLAASVACVPLVTCPETAPLIGALLQRPVTCDKAALSQDFLDAVSSAYSRKCVSLEAQAVVSLWCHNLASLEGAVMSLLDSVLSNPAFILHNLQSTITHSLLPKACSQHGSIFLIVNDIFRSMLVQVEGNQTLLSLIHTFTICFLRELAALQPQECVSLKAFFPHTPQSLLAPLLTHPSEMAQEAWPEHLAWITASLQRLTEEEEEEEGNRGQCGVFEAWFLLVQCADWLEVANQLLVSARPQDCGPLLWLLTFYHHPTNRGHHRTQQLVAAREVWDHLRSLFLLSAPPLPADRLQSLAELMSAVPQQPSLDSLLVVSLLGNFAVFSHNPLSGAREILRMVVQRSGLVREAVCVLDMVELRLNRERASSSLTDRVTLRTRALRGTLTHMAQHDTHTHGTT